MIPVYKLLRTEAVCTGIFRIYQWTTRWCRYMCVFLAGKTNTRSVF